MKKLILMFYVMCASTNNVFAVEIPHIMKETMSHETGMPSLLNLIVSMVLVIGMIYVTGWIYNKLNIVNRDKLAKINSKGIDSNRFNVIQTMPLGQQRHLYSIEMNGKVFLIGSTPSHINVLKEFDTEIEPEEEEKKDSLLEQAVKRNVGNTDIDELYKKYKN